MLELRPILIVVINFLAGGLVTHGVLDPNSANQFTQDAETAVGAVILLSTSLISLWRLVHKHPFTLAPATQDTASKQVVVTETITTPTIDQSVTSGTPPVIN